MWRNGRCNSRLLALIGSTLKRLSYSKARQSERGAVLIIAMIAMVVMVGFSIAYALLTTTQSKRVTTTTDYDTSCQATKAGFDMAKVVLVSGHDIEPLGWDDELELSYRGEDPVVYLNREAYNGNELSYNDIETDTSQFMWGQSYAYEGMNYMAMVTDNDAGNPSEDGNPRVDTDELVILTVTSWLPKGTEPCTKTIQSTVQAIVRYKDPVYEPDTAINTGGALSLIGNATVDGEQGSIYATGDVSISGSSSVLQDVFTPGVITGEENVGGDCYEGAPAPDVPEIDPSAYRDKADYILEPNGDVFQQVDGVKVEPKLGTADKSTAVVGWTYDVDNLTWTNSGVPVDGTFYVENGNMDIAGNLGSIDDPWQVTLLVNGVSPTGQVNIRGTGNATLVPDEDSVAIMAINNIDIAGNLNVKGGLVATHEQIAVIGNVDIEGSVVAESATLGVVGVAVAGGGNAAITYDGGMVTFLEHGDPYIKVMAYKRIK